MYNNFKFLIIIYQLQSFRYKITLDDLVKTWQSEVGGQFAHRSLIFITFYLRKIKFKKKIKV